MENSKLEEFCGGPVWDANLTWNTNRPDFTECFQNSILIYAQCAFLWIALPFYSIYLCRRPTVLGGCRTKLHYARLTGVAMLAVISMISCIRGIKDLTTLDHLHLSTVVTPFLQLVTYMTILYLINVEYFKNVYSSAILFLFFFISVISGLIPLYSFTLRASRVRYIENRSGFAVYIIFYCTILTEFILYCFSDIRKISDKSSKDKKSSEKKPCPEVEASCLSILTYWWMNSLMLRGYKKSITEDDVWLPNPRELTRNAAPPLEKAWAAELNTANMKDKTITTPENVPMNQKKSSEEGTPLNGLKFHTTKDVEVKTGKKSKSPSLFRALVRGYGLQLLEAHAYKFIEDLVIITGPIIQRLLINYVEDESVETWKGYLYAAIFFVLTITNTILYEKMFQLGSVMGLRVRSALISAVYKKALRISNAARSKTTVGEIVNLMSVDADRLFELSSDLWVLWSAPLQICLAFYFLYNLLGPPVLSGVAILVLFFPINGYVAYLQTRLVSKVMDLKDIRIKLINELLAGIKVVKLNAWERSFEEKISAIRRKELKHIRTLLFLYAVQNFFWTTAPFIIMLTMFVTYILTGGILDAATAFTAMSFINILKYPTSELPLTISYTIMAGVSVKRLRQFLLTDDIDEEFTTHQENNTDAIRIEDGTFAWNSEGELSSPTLKCINLRIPMGKLYAVVGPVGCGKSSLISAMLGEMLKLKGTINISGSVAYVAQQPWIQNMTLRDNVLFGSPYNEKKYQQVLKACALLPDLAILPSGDMTEIGEKGINLSGGQKQRVSLARAVYADRDLYLLDDALSAVDAHVGREIFNEVIAGPSALLASKTVLLVTHGLHWLSSVDGVVVISEGQISELGSYEELRSHDGPFAELLKTYLNTDTEEEQVEEVHSARDLKRLNSKEYESHVYPGSPTSTCSNRLRTQLSVSSAEVHFASNGRLASRQTSYTAHDEKQEKSGEVTDKLIEDEETAVGAVKLSVYGRYFRAMGVTISILAFLSYAFCEASSVTSSIWLSHWTADPLMSNQSLYNTSLYQDQTYFYLAVFGAIGSCQVAFTFIYSVLMVFGFARASKVLHKGMLGGILRSPLSFFDTTPTGRILNRFSRDIESVDDILPMCVKLCFITSLMIISTSIVISYSTPIFMILIVPLCVVYYFIQRLYLPTSRQLKRIMSVTRSPIYAHFSETLSGVGTIRAYNAQQRFIEESEAKVDYYVSFHFANMSANRWIGLWLQFLGALIVLSTALFSVIGRGSISAGLVGLATTYALQLTDNLEFMVHITSWLEASMVSVERIEEYTRNTPESAWMIDGSLSDASWPRRGEIRFDGYSTRYRTGLDLVLRNLSLTINPGEKVGVVGRTGAGKSTITLALLRILEACEGEIYIDDQPISALGLHQLRASITILPQDPVLFAGTLRMNVDPLGRYSDSEIWKALEHSHLKSFVLELASGLEYECGEGGLNLSVGQRQLVCLARALLKRTKVLILDEATAAVDMETDELIQKTIRENFTDCTVVAIAHRLNTIIDYDRILVMDAGELSEYDTPTNLLNDKSSKFYSMAKDANLVQ